MLIERSAEKGRLEQPRGFGAVEFEVLPRCYPIEHGLRPVRQNLLIYKVYLVGRSGLEPETR
jgi:hypothetical protein